MFDVTVMFLTDSYLLQLLGAQTPKRRSLVIRPLTSGGPAAQRGCCNLK